MSTRAQLLVASAAAAVGLATLGVYLIVARPEATYRNVGIGTLVYAAGYLLAVPRADRWLQRRFNLPGSRPEGSSQH